MKEDGMLEKVKREFVGLLTEVRDRSAFQALNFSPLMKVQRGLEDAAVKFPLPSSLPAHCGCCNEFVLTEFTARHSTVAPNGSLHLAFSETAVCPSCRINSRMRFACDILRAWFGGIPDGLYLTEQKTPLFRALSQRSHEIVGSEFLGPEHTPGKLYDGIMHQDLHYLTFDSGKFNSVLCLDVLEHVNDPLRCVVELHRVLRAGGCAVVTFPFFPGRDSSVRRSRILPDGTIEYMLAAEYHGNPLGGGSLVFSELSWDFLSELRGVLGKDMIFVHYASMHHAHFGANRFALILTKEKS